MCGHEGYQRRCNGKSGQHFDNCACVMERVEAVEVLMEHEQVLMQAVQCLEACVGRRVGKDGEAARNDLHDVCGEECSSYREPEV